MKYETSSANEFKITFYVGGIFSI